MRVHIFQSLPESLMFKAHIKDTYTIWELPLYHSYIINVITKSQESVFHFTDIAQS